jgi:hypothetical protein
MDIKNLFLQEQTDYIRKFQFRVIILITVVALLLVYFFPKNYGFIIILIVFLYFLSNEYIKVEEVRTTDFNKDTYYKLLGLQRIMDKYVQKQIQIKRVPIHLRSKIYERHRLSSLYTDSDLIHFLDSIKNLQDYSDDEFFLLLKGTNNILLIHKQMQDYYDANGYFPENLIENIEIAFDLRTNCINNMHNFVYTIPKTNVLRNYHHKIIERYTVLINRHIDNLFEFKKTSIQLKGINTNSKLHYINLTNKTKPNDTFNHQFII